MKRGYQKKKKNHIWTKHGNIRNVVIQKNKRDNDNKARKPNIN